MNALQTFDFEGKPLRIIDRDGTVWFIAKDVCAILELGNMSDTIAKLDNDEKDKIAFSDSIGRMRQTPIIDESGFSTIILRSQQAMVPGTLPHRFRKKVTKEIIPLVRRGKLVPVETVSQEPSRAPAPVDGETRMLQAAAEIRMIWGPAAAGRYLVDNGFKNYGKPPALPSPAEAEAYNCFRYLLAAEYNGRKIGDLIRAAFRADREARKLLETAGISVKGEGFTVMNVHKVIAEIFAGTRWERPFEYLRNLPDALPYNPRGGGYAREMTFLPSTLLSKA